MKKLLLFTPLFITSCKADSSGNYEPTWVFWLFIILILGLFIHFALDSADRSSGKSYSNNKRRTIYPKYIEVGSYAGGHPAMNKVIDSVVFRSDKTYIEFYERKDIASHAFSIFKIDKAAVVEINIDDQSTIENKITLGRVILVGVFALAWKKKKKNEIAFLTITWKDDRFTHNTIFSFETKNAMEKANTARNLLINSVKSPL